MNRVYSCIILQKYIQYSFSPLACLEIYKTTDLNASKIPAIMYWLVLNFEDIHSTCVSVMCRCHSVL